MILLLGNYCNNDHDRVYCVLMVVLLRKLLIIFVGFSVISLVPVSACMCPHRYLRFLGMGKPIIGLKCCTKCFQKFDNTNHYTSCSVKGKCTCANFKPYKHRNSNISNATDTDIIIISLMDIP